MGILKRQKKTDDAGKQEVEKIIAPVKKSEKTEKVVATKKLRPQNDHVILYPLVTEKASVLTSQGQYSFVVGLNVNRIQVRDAIIASYGVVPTSVNIQVVRGKRVRHGRIRGKRKDWKKAIITLPKGKTINVYEGV